MHKLTATAKGELKHVIADLVEKNEQFYVDFFNNAQPLSTRMHSLELLPGLGKKHMWEIIEARRDKSFDNFEDLKKRVEMLPDPKKMIKRRIIEELQEIDRHRLFVLPRSQTPRQF